MPHDDFFCNSLYILSIFYFSHGIFFVASVMRHIWVSSLCPIGPIQDFPAIQISWYIYLNPL